MKVVMKNTSHPKDMNRADVDRDTNILNPKIVTVR